MLIYIIYIDEFYKGVFGCISLFTIGTIISALLYRLFIYCKNNSLISITVMIVVAASSSSFYSYFCYSNIRSVVECVALGMLFGVLISFIFDAPSQNSGAHPLGNPGQRHYNKSSSANLPPLPPLPLRKRPIDE